MTARHPLPRPLLAAVGEPLETPLVGWSGTHPSGRLLPAQVEFTGGSGPWVLAAFLTFLVAVVLSVVVTHRFVEGYRSTGSRPVLYLAVGMFLLAPAPMFLRLVLGNAPGVDADARALATTCSELLGLLALLWVVFRR